VATDQATDQVGGAATSCVGSMDVFIVYGSAPGFGVVHAQAAVNVSGRNEAVNLLGQGIAPADIILAITDLGFDASAETRQYGVVDLQGRSAGFTGSNTISYADDVQGQVGTFTYSVQGNILTSQAVIDQVETAFRGQGCDLADRLMQALEAGAVGGEGDSRCTGQGIPSDSGFIHVDLDDGTVFLHLSVTNTSPDSPLTELRTEYDIWRAQNPCPEPQSDGGVSDAGMPDGAVPDGGVNDGGSTSPDAATGNGGGSSDGGCGCRLAHRRGGQGVLLVMALMLLLILLPRRS
jgi:uncharacterized Ntn-hydrolase superfamily protein